MPVDHRARKQLTKPNRTRGMGGLKNFGGSSTPKFSDFGAPKWP